MAFISKLKDIPEDRYIPLAKGGMVKSQDMIFTVAMSGHKDVGTAFQALDGVIRAAASLGARNAAGKILYLSSLMVPYDKGDLQISGKVEKAEMDDKTDIGAMGRKIGGGLGEGELVTEAGASMGSSLGQFANISAAELMRQPVRVFNVVYTDDKAWFVHEYEQNYKQAGEPTTSHPESMRVPDSGGRKRGTKFLERAINEVAPSYPDWVAVEIQKGIDLIKAPEMPAVVKTPFDGRPRLVKRAK